MSASTPMREESLTIRLFGPLDVRVAGKPLPRLRSRRGAWLLALLALRHGREVQREWLAGVLWPESDPEKSLENLRRTLTNLRAALGKQKDRLRSPTLRTLILDLSGDAFADVVAFDSLLAKQDPTQLEQALELYRGPLLEDCLEDWAVPERESRAQAYVTALECLARNAIQQNSPLEAVSFLRRIVAVDALNESAYRLLMRALTDAGDYAAMTRGYRDLQRLLRREMNADPDPETVTLFHTLSRETRRHLGTLQKEATARYSRANHREALPAPSPASFPQPNLPVPITSFIGREAEREEVRRLLSARRLLTLTGTGGVGKTRLAVQVASEVTTEYSGGVWFVDLAPISDPALVEQAVAIVLGVKAVADRPLLDLLGEKLCEPTLLLLDNGEHLIAACARLAEALLARCPSLRLLATSRESLNVQGGAVWRVPSLSLPVLSSPEEKEGVDELVVYDGIRLFVERARLVSPDFVLARQNTSLVMQICRRLDGIPLAIELAAARLQGLSVEQIATRLDDRFRLLTRGNRGALPRHQTLRAAIEWSYDLLSPAERTMLRRVTVFAGGWTLEAAEALCTSGSEGDTDPEEILREDVADLLVQLVDKSMAIYNSEPPPGRFHLLETIRQYASQQPRPPREEEALRRRHRDWYLQFAGEADEQLIGPEQGFWLGRLEAEHDNLRAALDFCAGEPGGSEAALRMTGSLGRFWEMRGYLYEGRRRTEEALRRDGAQKSKAARVNSLYSAGVLAIQQFALAEARVWLEEGLEICREQDDRKKRSSFLDTLGLVELEAGNTHGAARLFQESLDLSRALQDRKGMAESFNNLGRAAFAQGEYAAARAFHEESLALWREFGDRLAISSVLVNLGNLSHMQGDFAEARAIYEETLRLKRELGQTIGVALVLSNLGLLVSRQGDYPAALAFHEECLQLRRELGDRSGIASALNNLGEVALNQQDWARAQPLLEESLTLAQSIGDNTICAITLNNLGVMAQQQGDSESAETYLQQSLALWRILGDPANIGLMLSNLGILAVQREDLHLGYACFAESLQLRRQLGDKVGIAWLLQTCAEIAVAQQCWERAARCFAACVALRRQMGIRQSPTKEAHLSQQRDRVQSNLPVEQFDALWQQAESLTWQEAANLVEEATRDTISGNDPDRE